MLFIFFQAEELKTATQLSGEVMPVSQSTKKERARKLTVEEKKFSAFNTIRQARAHKRLNGLRLKKIREAEEENK